MASFFTSLKCNNCAGSLTFDRAKKVWVCDYCGSEIIREERSEGPYSIKGVAVRALTDMAEDDLDSGEKNLAECEKLDPKHAATLICRLCLNVLKLSDPDNAGNARALISQLKRDYTALNELDGSISPEEEALYEALGERPDVFAMLLLTFDTLGAKEHRDFAQHLLDPGAITSPKMNATLLGYALKRGQAEMVNKITSNLSCIDRRDSFLTVLAQMPDGESKRSCVERLLKGFRLDPDDRLIVNSYLEESEDSPETKLAVFCAASAAGAMATLSKMAAVAAGHADAQMSLTFADAVCEGKPTDDELSVLLAHLFAEYDADPAVKMLERFQEKKLFLAITGNMLVRMLSRTDITAADKCAILTAAEQFKIDARTNNAVLADYLMIAKDIPADRLELVRCLLTFVGTPATATIENYTLKCGIDGEVKSEILKLLLENVSSGFLRELPKAYMASSCDDPAVKKQVLALMTGNGLALDANSLVSIACNATPATADEAAATIRQALSGGARLRSDALNEYLETVAPENLSKKLVSALHSPGGKLSDEALQKYIFHCDDDVEVKLRNALIFSEQNHNSFGNSSCAIRHQGSELRCNLLQAYLLLCSDTPEAVDMLSLMLDEGELEARILVNGVNTKFHKYVTGQRRSLSPLAEQICASAKLFNKLF